MALNSTPQDNQPDVAAQIAVVRIAMVNMRTMRQQSLGRPLTPDEDVQLQREMAVLPNEALFALAGNTFGGNQHTPTSSGSPVALTLRKTILIAGSFVLCGLVFGYAALNGRVSIPGIALSIASFGFAGTTVWHYRKTKGQT